MACNAFITVVSSEIIASAVFWTVLTVYPNHAFEVFRVKDMHSEYYSIWPYVFLDAVTISR